MSKDSDSEITIKMSWSELDALLSECQSEIIQLDEIDVVLDEEQS